MKYILSTAIVTLAICALVWFCLSGPTTGTKFQAVLLTNGAVYYGKVSGIGSTYLTMTDVFTIERKLDGSSLLTQRVVSEFHAPTKTILNAAHVVAIDSVAAESVAGKLLSNRPTVTKFAAPPNMGK